jgi:hypothetical protein
MMDNKIRILCVVILVAIFISLTGLFVAYGDNSRHIKFRWEKISVASGYIVTVKKYYGDIKIMVTAVNVGNVNYYIYIIPTGSGITEYCFTVRSYAVAPVTSQYIESVNSREVCIEK